MNTYALSRLSDHALLRDLASLVAQDRTTTAALLAHIAEVDARRLYLPAACPSMFAYCMRELGLSEKAAFKRIHAARAARRFPAIFGAVAEGRLHLSAVVLLAPYLTQATADELLAAAARKTKSEIEELLAERFPRPDVPARIDAISRPTVSPSAVQHAPGRVEALDFGRPDPPAAQHALGRVDERRPKLTPLAPQRFALQLTIGQSTRDKLRYAQELLSHQIPSGNVAEVLDLALEALIRQLEKRKFTASEKPSPRRRRRTAAKRHVPAEVKRAVWERDGGQCTFVSEAGQRCPARKFLEFDHIEEVARGGRATVSGVRLSCRPHNQYGAECTFGAGFMEQKRQEARRATAETCAASEARAAAERAQVRDHGLVRERPAVGGWYSTGRVAYGPHGCRGAPYLLQ